ncbi:unnamed protein product [Hermetia illucens]|uniref:Uncharacterized protein n=1 Tax=Hermetia illucens TaxID=343691 RepID=A0A7R8UE63_HERIL|nr:unnamed protein product [Hermetia illucens]
MPNILNMPKRKHFADSFVTKDTPVEKQDIKEAVLKLWCKIIWKKEQTLILKIPNKGGKVVKLPNEQINVIRDEVMHNNLNATPIQQKLELPVTT